MKLGCEKCLFFFFCFSSSSGLEGVGVKSTVIKQLKWQGTIKQWAWGWLHQNKNFSINEKKKRPKFGMSDVRTYRRRGKGLGGKRVGGTGPKRTSPQTKGKCWVRTCRNIQRQSLGGTRTMEIGKHLFRRSKFS